MHEYSVVSELVALLLPRVGGIDGRVVSVHLRKGELRILSDASLVAAFEIVTSGTPLEGATLEIETVTTSVRCGACGYAGLAKHLEDESFHFAIPILACPRCGAEVEVTSGRELSIESVRVASLDPDERQDASGEEGGCRSSGAA